MKNSRKNKGENNKQTTRDDDDDDNIALYLRVCVC